MRGSLHSVSRETAAQQLPQVAEDRLAEEDEDPRVHDGVERRETEGDQVEVVVAGWPDRADVATYLRGDKATEKEIKWLGLRRESLMTKRNEMVRCTRKET